MAFWWPLLVAGIAFAICKLLFMLIPPNVPSIEVDASDVLEDGSQTKENSYIYIPRKGKSAQTDKVQCYEPATMKYLGYFPALTPDEVKEHVAQARKAQKTWAKSSFRQRRQFLRILLKYIIEHQELICEISSRDTGKTMVDASLGEIMTTCEKITWLLDEGEKWLKPEYRCSGRSMLHKRAKVEFYPLGVIGAIVSWNYPFHNIFNPMLAAVFSGNAAVIKVSEHASWSGCFYLRIIQAALAAVGAPDNLVHVITGFAETGQALVSSVDKIIFVGSPGVGKMIMRKASETLIPVTLELGGKDAFIVCEDVDVPHVVQIATRAALQSSGQNCAGAERFYVHKDVYSTFVAQIVKLVKSVSAGPPSAGKYDMGAICMQEHADKLQNLVNDALEKGAEIAGRGSFGHLGEDAVDQFFPPTVLVNVNHTMKLMQEEAFGPIIPIMKFSDDEEVIKLANDSNYGLGCAVFSGSQKRAIAIASQLHCGVAAINDFASTYMCHRHIELGFCSLSLSLEKKTRVSSDPQSFPSVLRSRVSHQRFEMARNEEKAQSMLNRFITMKSEEKKKPKERRPYLASECRDLADADKWRSEILREIGVKVAEIQNEGLGEHRLRDLNDEINKLLRERVHWERRIVELGGHNYMRHSAKMTDLEGNIIDVPNPSGRGPGYRYFGAAKKLPGVKELFEKPPEIKKRRSRYDIYKRINASYYGYRDDEDGILEKLEGPAEAEMRKRAVEEWKKMEEIRKEARKAVKSGEVVSVGPAIKEILFEGVEDVVEEERALEREREEKERKEEFVVHVPLPDDKEIERMVLEKKKMELLNKYTSDMLIEEQSEAKDMLNIKR